MPSKFLSLKPEKQERILNAAIKEFARKGFEKASTNEIVKEANIGKGMLFHYFKSKKDLFLFLYDHTLDIVMTEFLGKLDWNEKDVFNRLRQMVYAKLELMKKYPEIFNFLMAANRESSGEVRKELESRNKEVTNAGYRKAFEDIDFGKFKEGIDIQKALNIIVWTVEGFAAKQQEKAGPLSLNELHTDELLAEMDRYLELLKNCFYKPQLKASKCS